MKNLITILCLIPTFLFSQETYKYFGTAYNETQGVGGPFYVEMTINPDNSVSGFLDADPYPGQQVFCGAGDFDGTINNDTLSVTVNYYDSDDGCGFVSGWTAVHNFYFSSNRQFVTGDYYIQNNNTTGDVYLRTENECVDISSLEAIYQSKLGTTEELYAKQYLCLAQKTCSEYNITGNDGWAGGFVRYMFDYMNTHNRGNTGLDFVCSPTTSKERCFASTGLHHLYVELTPAFFNYCKKVEDLSDILNWTTDHEQFISNAVETCFDELNSTDCSILPPVLCEAFFYASKKSTISSVRNLRLTAQAYCSINLINGDIFDLSDEIPAALAQDSIFSTDLAQLSDILLSSDTFFLKVGASHQVSAILNDGSGMDVTNSSTGTEYYLNVDNSIASISENGLITINGSNMPLINSRSPLYVFAKNGNNIGVGQFAIYDNDSDGDLIIDSYEEKLSLNPNFNNGLNYDQDFDGLIDFIEVNIGTNPFSNDSDLDGFIDPYEFAVRTDPLDPNRTPITLLTSTKEILYSPEGIKIYPNPTNGEVTISFSPELIGKEFDELVVLDVTGRQLFKQDHEWVLNEDINLNLLKLPTGIFYIQFKIENQVLVKKIIKR